MTAGLLSALAIGYLGPVNGYLGQRADLADERANLVQLEAERVRLEHQVRALDRPPVLEARARELGLVRPGERAFVIQGLRAPAPPATAHDEGGGPFGWLTRLF